MKKIIVSKEFLYILGFALDALGGAFIFYSGFGITAMSAFPLVIYDIFPIISIGTTNFIVQVVILIFLLLFLKKFSSYYLCCFFAAFIYDVFLDLFIFLLAALPHNSLLNCLYLVLNILCVGAAIALYMRCSMPLMPFDVVVQELSSKLKLREGVMKIITDLFFLTSAAVISYLFFNEFRYIGVATVLCAITIGFFTDIFLIIFDRFIDYRTTTKIGRTIESLTIKNENSKIEMNKD